MSTVTISGISRSFGAQRVLHHVDLTVANGSITSVLGPSGCGKTTLLRIVAGFVQADEGTVRVGDRVVEGPGVHIGPEKRGVGYVPQEGALFPHLDVAANIGFGLPRRQRTAAKLREMLDLAELPSTVAGRYPHELSGGQQQRVAIARALAPAPSVVLLDEPFSSLDAALRISAGREVTRVLRHAGATALLVTHDQGEALSLADQVALMRAGRFVQVDTPSRLYEAPVDAEAAEFVGGATVLTALVRRGVAATPLGHLAVSGTTDGPVQLLIRPEQVEIGRPDSPAKATVTEVSYYGAHVVFRLLLPDGEVLTARGRSTSTPAVDDVVGVSIKGPVVGHPDPRAKAGDA